MPIGHERIDHHHMLASHIRGESTKIDAHSSDHARADRSGLQRERGDLNCEMVVSKADEIAEDRLRPGIERIRVICRQVRAAGLRLPRGPPPFQPCCFA